MGIAGLYPPNMSSPLMGGRGELEGPLAPLMAQGQQSFDSPYPPGPDLGIGPRGPRGHAGSASDTAHLLEDLVNLWSRAFGRLPEMAGGLFQDILGGGGQLFKQAMAPLRSAIGYGLAQGQRMLPDMVSGGALAEGLANLPQAALGETAKAGQGIMQNLIGPALSTGTNLLSLMSGPLTAAGGLLKKIGGGKK